MSEYKSPREERLEKRKALHAEILRKAAEREKDLKPKPTHRSVTRTFTEDELRTIALDEDPNFEIVKDSGIYSSGRWYEQNIVFKEKSSDKLYRMDIDVSGTSDEYYFEYPTEVYEVQAVEVIKTKYVEIKVPIND